MTDQHQRTLAELRRALAGCASLDAACAAIVAAAAALAPGTTGTLYWWYNQQTGSVSPIARWGAAAPDQHGAVELGLALGLPLVGDGTTIGILVAYPPPRSRAGGPDDHQALAELRRVMSALVAIAAPGLEQVERAAALAQATHEDPATGLPLWSAVAPAVAAALRQPAGCGAALLLIGFDQAERALSSHAAALARLLRAQLGGEATLARDGAGQVVAVLRATNGPCAAACAEQLRRLVERGGLGQSAQGQGLTISVGVVELPRAEARLDVALAAAVDALACARHAGRNQVVIGDDLRLRLRTGSEGD